jgi:hypothetical protein
MKTLEDEVTEYTKQKKTVRTSEEWEYADNML